MTRARDIDVWAPPQPPSEYIVSDGGVELLYVIVDDVYRREVRAWLRTTNRWAHPAVTALGVLGVVLCAGVLAGLAWVDAPLVPLAFGFVFMMAMFMAVILHPITVARRMARRRGGELQTRVSVQDGHIRLRGARELSVRVSALTAIRERPEVWWLMFGRGMVVFISKRTRQGDVGAFLDRLRAQQTMEHEPEVVPVVRAQASFRAPSRVLHIARNYAIALRSPFFLLLVVLTALSMVGAVAAMPWRVSQDLVVPLFVLGTTLALLLTLPAWRILIATRESLGERSSVVTWSALGDVLRMDAPRGTAQVPWTDVRRLRRIGRFALLELSNGRYILATTDAVSGDPMALFAAIDTHLGESCRD